MLAQASSPLDLPTLRHRLGLTQTELAAVLKVSVRTVRRWEQGAPMHLIWQDRLTGMYLERFPRQPVPRLAKGAAV